MLCCFLAYCQEAEFSVASRLEGNWTDGDGLYWGNSSLYTFLDGSFSEHFSYSVANHWLGDGVRDLYTDVLHDDTNTFVDWANITGTLGPWGLTLGKQCLSIGTFLFDEYDVDVHYPFASNMWLNDSVYQWGGKISYTPVESTTFEFQVASSAAQQGLKYFENGDMSYSFLWSGEYGPFSLKWSFNAFEYRNDEFIKKTVERFAFGNRLELDPVTLTLDASFMLPNSVKFLAFDKSIKYSEFYLTADSDINDHFSVSAMAGLEWSEFFKGALALHYYPLSDKSLRVHAVAGYDGALECTEVSIGATYWLSFSLFNK